MFLKIKKFFLTAAFEYSIALLFLAYLLTYDMMDLPSFGELVEALMRGFEMYGFWFLFLGLLVEGLFVVGFYIPGSTVALVAVIALGTSPLRTLAVVGVGSFAIIAINIVNYMLGKYGYYRLLARLGAKGAIDRMKRRFDAHEKKTIFLSSMSPNFLSIASIYAGIARAPLGRYVRFMALSVFFWVSLVSFVVYAFFQEVVSTANSSLGWYVFGALILWAVIESIISMRQESDLAQA